MKQEYENEPLIRNLGPGSLTRTDFCARYFFIRFFFPLRSLLTSYL